MAQPQSLEPQRGHSISSSGSGARSAAVAPGSGTTQGRCRQEVATSHGGLGDARKQLGALLRGQQLGVDAVVAPRGEALADGLHGRVALRLGREGDKGCVALALARLELGVDALASPS